MPNAKRRTFWRTPAVAADWYTLTLKNGNTIKLQGSYEYRYACWLDSNDIEFIAQPKPALEYTDRFGGKHRYTPDFWVDGAGYVEIKSSYTLKKDRKKLNEVIASGHKITILTEVELAELGIDMKAKIEKGKPTDVKKSKSRGQSSNKRKSSPALDSTSRDG